MLVYNILVCDAYQASRQVAMFFLSEGGGSWYIYGSASTIWTKWVDSFLGYLKTRQLLSSWLKSLRQQCVDELWIRALSTPISPHVELWYYTFHHEWIQMWRRCSSKRVMEKVININGRVYLLPILFLKYKW